MKKIIIKRSKGLNLLKVLSTLLNYGAEITFQEIETYLKEYEIKDMIEVKGSNDSIEKSILDFDSYGVDYEVVD